MENLDNKSHNVELFKINYDLFSANKNKNSLIDLLSSRRDFPKDWHEKHIKFFNINDNFFSKHRRVLFRDDDLANEPWLPCDVLELEKSITTHQGFVFYDNSLIVDNQYSYRNWFRAEEGELGGLSDIVLKNNIHEINIIDGCGKIVFNPHISKIKDPCFLFDSRFGWGNLGHLMHDTALQIPTYLELVRRYGKVRPVFLAAGFKYPAMREIINRLLGPYARDILFTNWRMMEFEKLFVPLKHIDFGVWSISRPAGLRLKRLVSDSFRDLISNDLINIYISRKDSNRDPKLNPNMQNEADFLNFIEQKGFLEIEASKIDIDKYFKIFCNSRTILGVHGAGLVNFALSPSSSVIELTVPGFPSWRSIEAFANSMSERFIRLNCSICSNGDFSVDKDELDKAINFANNET